VVSELTAELLVDRLDPREIAVSGHGRFVAFVAAPAGRPCGSGSLALRRLHLPSRGSNEESS
jgi:hypothetical protein